MLFSLRRLLRKFFYQILNSNVCRYTLICLLIVLCEFYNLIYDGLALCRSLSDLVVVFC